MQSSCESVAFSAGGEVGGRPLMCTTTLASSPFLPATTASSFICFLAQKASELRLRSSIGGIFPVTPPVPLTSDLSLVAGAAAAPDAGAPAAPDAGAAALPEAGVAAV